MSPHLVPMESPLEIVHQTKQETQENLYEATLQPVTVLAYFPDLIYFHFPEF